MRLQINKTIFILPLVLICIVLYPDLALTQGTPVEQDLVRSKIWSRFWETGMPAQNALPYGVGKISYPSYYGSGGRNEVYRWSWSHNFFAVRNDTVVSGGFDHYQALGGYTPLSHTRTENYNFENYGPTVPEEMLVAVSEPLDPDLYAPNPESHALRLLLKVKTMAWSLPKYDDFLITEYVITNLEQVPIYNFYYHQQIPLHGPQSGMSWDPGNRVYRYDKEYIWDENRQVFIIYDDTAIPPELGEPIQYAIEPGVTTGDVGNPGNIREVGSIDFKLYAPICQGFGFVKVPVNANGEAKIERLITNFHVPNTRHPSCIKREKPFHGQSINFGGEYTNPLPEDPTQPRTSVYPPEMQQPLMSYREAAEDPTVEDGNLYERDPNVHNAIGPYTMQPGDSIKFYRILCFGDMDRNISMRGGLEATKQLDMDFVSPNEGAENEHAAIKNFRKNWDAAMYLIENNFTPEAVPPPTPGLPPRTGHPEEELKAEASVLEVDGKRQAAIELRWNDVHTGYKDALTGADDFAGYYVYRSDVAVEGPWEKIATITKEQANQKLDGDQVVHKVEARPGVPFRYSVTSFDTDGLESGRTCYTLDAISSKRAPEDDQSLVRVVPNPFKQIAGFFDDREQKRLAFVNIPAVCTIRIYNLAGDLIQTVKHDDGFGEEAWGSSVNDENNYMLTRFRQNVMPGLYIYHIESHVSGHEGETSVGKFAVIK